MSAVQIVFPVSRLVYLFVAAQWGRPLLRTTLLHCHLGPTSMSSQNATQQVTVCTTLTPRKISFHWDSSNSHGKPLQRVARPWIITRRKNTLSELNLYNYRTSARAALINYRFVPLPNSHMQTDCVSPKITPISTSDANLWPSGQVVGKFEFLVIPINFQVEARRARPSTSEGVRLEKKYSFSHLNVKELS